jgi:hypothetical protein
MNTLSEAFEEAVDTGTLEQDSFGNVGPGHVLAYHQPECRMRVTEGGEECNCEPRFEIHSGPSATCKVCRARHH